jgi:dTDP-4-dehydrorhamnose reductase
VFDGNSQQPLKEDAPVAPVNFYGESKLRGEQEALKENPESVIIRTSWVYSVYGKNFVKTMLRLMTEKESISVVADQWGSPTYAADLAKAVLQLIESGRWQPGIYHFSNDGVINWAQFAGEIARQANRSCKVNSITTDQYPTLAKRPAYSVMDKQKIASVYHIQIRPWKESLQECIRKLNEGTVHQ